LKNKYSPQILKCCKYSLNLHERLQCERLQVISVWIFTGKWALSTCKYGTSCFCQICVLSSCQTSTSFDWFK